MRFPCKRCFGFFLLCALQTGCSEFVPAVCNKGKGLYQSHVLVVPFSEPRNSRWYCESERGRQVTEALMNWAREECQADFAEGEEVERVLQAVRDWQESEKIASRDWKSLTGNLGVAYVVVGEIRNLELRSSKSIGIVDASVTATYRVVNVIEGKEGRIAYQSPSKRVLYGNPQQFEPPLVDLGADLEVVERRLLAKLGVEIGKDLYGYYRG